MALVKALSVSRPWASMFALGKDVENRSWGTAHRGLLVIHAAKSFDVAAKDFVANWVSGLCLMFALRSALADAWWVWVAMWLLASGLVHAGDLWSRWQR